MFHAQALMLAQAGSSNEGWGWEWGVLWLALAVLTAMVVGAAVAMDRRRRGPMAI